jgi:outer membrane protein OmpA-like peptidoglycan-associated protein
MNRLIITLLLIAGAASALPSWWGVRGLNRIVDARTEGSGKYMLGLFGFMGLSTDVRTTEMPEGMTEVENTEYDATVHMVSGIVLGRSAEIGLSATYLVNQNRLSQQQTDAWDGDWEGDDGFSEASLALKYNFNPSASALAIGVMPWVSFAIYDGGYLPYVDNGDGFEGFWEEHQPQFEMRRPMINSGDFSYGARLLASLQMNPAVLHINLGYDNFKQNFQFTDHRYDADHGIIASQEVDIDVEDPVVYAGAGLEYPMGSTILFAEFEWRHFLDRDFENADGEDVVDVMQLAPGVRFNTNGLAIDVTGSFALSTFDPEWSDLGHSLYQAGGSPTDDDRANFTPIPLGYVPEFGLGVGLSYVGDFSKPPATVGGRVYDAESNESIDGSVASSSGGEPAVAVGGRYSMEIPAGEAVLTASADNYLPDSRTVQAVEGGTHTVDFALDRIDGNVIGTVTSRETGIPIAAVISVVGAPRPASVNCQDNGLYQMSVPFGERTIKAEAPGFLSDTQTVQVPARGTITVDFQLRPALVQGQVLTFNDIYFDFDRSNIKPESYPVLDSIVEMFLENSEVRIEIAGHTDSDGSEAYNQNLSEERAASVLNYLVEHGVPARRLTTVGYGETRPVVPNTSAANKAQNRRIEFTVLGR